HAGDGEHGRHGETVGRVAGAGTLTIYLIAPGSRSRVGTRRGGTDMARHSRIAPACLLLLLGFGAHRAGAQQAAVAAAPATRQAMQVAGGFGPLSTTLGAPGGTGSPLLTLALSPDGKTAAAGAEDGTVLLYDLAARTVRQTLKGHEDAVTCV